MRSHAWRLFRTALRNRLLGLIDYAPLADLPLPGWLRLLAKLTRPRGDSAQAAGERLCRALIELGPVYVKLGQLLSTRPDIIPPAMAAALSRLQDQVPPFPGEKALGVIGAQFQRPLDSIFRDIDSVPLASASIAQVHAATLLTGEAVVIKVVRPDILASIDETLGFLKAVAQTLESRSSNIRRLRLREVVDDYDRTIHAELDLAQEARNTATLRSNFAYSELLYVPRVHHDLSNRNVMVMERINGIPISAVAQMEAAGVDKALLANRGVETFFKQVFIDNFFHADMHPGNVFVDISTPADPRYIALDCAIIGSLTPGDQEYLARNLVAFFNRDYVGVARLHLESGWVPATTDLAAFSRVIEQVCEPHFEKALADISFSDFLTDLFKTAERFNMQIQPQLVLLQKTLLYVEGLGRSLYPQLDLWKTAKPFMEHWLLDRFGPTALVQRALTRLPETIGLLADLPSWLPQMRHRLIVMEQRLSEQADTIASLKKKPGQPGAGRTVLSLVPLGLVAIGVFLLSTPIETAVLADQLWQTALGLGGVLGGLTLALRNRWR